MADDAVFVDDGSPPLFRVNAPSFNVRIGQNERYIVQGDVCLASAAVP